jgi:hypothetical protein
MGWDWYYSLQRALFATMSGLTNDVARFVWNTT